jgi:salicylate hydroxylase
MRARGNHVEAHTFAGAGDLDEGILHQPTRFSKKQGKQVLIGTKGLVALLGDACHPTLPYQAQGAAMAVEDGFAIGKLLGLSHAHLAAIVDEPPEYIPDLLKIYEGIRKVRTTRTVQAAVNNRKVFHIPDGIVQAVRDLVLGYAGVTSKSDWTWLFSGRMRRMLVHDLDGECEREFDKFVSTRG